MEQIICPRCEEPFGRNERFCKNCGIRKSKTISRVRWWLTALLINLLLMGIFAGIRERVVTASGYPIDLAHGTAWLMMGAVFLCLLLPTLCVYFVYLSLLLRGRGVMTKGTVTENYTETIERENNIREERKMSAIVFMPEVAHPTECRITTSGWLTIGSTVDVIYDPYRPHDYAEEGKKPTLVAPIAMTILGLVMATLPIFLMWVILQMPPGSFV